jgi:hypothetical protein
MDPNSLREHLKSLHEELVAARRASPRNEALLGSITAEIRRLIGQAHDAEAAGAARSLPLVSDEEDDSLPDRLERLAVQFEADHPTLAASSRRLIDLLGKAGL